MKIRATFRISIVGDSDSDESPNTWCTSKQETVELSSSEAALITWTEATKLAIWHGELHRLILGREQRADILSRALGRLNFKDTRGVEDLSKMEFKLKGENVELSLKNIENLRNKLTSNPTELWFKRFGIFPNMLYLMSFRKFLFIYKEMQGCYLWVERLCERL